MGLLVLLLFIRYIGVINSPNVKKEIEIDNDLFKKLFLDQICVKVAPVPMPWCSG